MHGPIDERTGLELLFRDECLALLRTEEVGRVAFVVSSKPMVVPVNYFMDGNSIVMQTVKGTKLDVLRSGSVAFEVDRLDAERRTGWSVVVQGRTEEITDAHEPFRFVQAQWRSWTAAPKEHWIRIVPTVVTGRRLERPGESVRIGTLVLATATEAEANDLVFEGPSAL